MKKLISFAIPSYNSEAYMSKCIDSLLVGGEDVEILIVNDGSKDRTGEIALEYQNKYPKICKAINQENKGHGGAVNTGLENATGKFYKVVDSDDWVDAKALKKVISILKKFDKKKIDIDMFIVNYVYEHAYDGTSHVVNYKNVFPQDKVITWDDTKDFRVDQNLLMHSVIYKTEVLRECGLKLPEHTFYVDNIFVYNPLPYVKKMYYANLDFYRYFIGRPDQSVNEQVMIKRIDQQIRVNKIMIDAYELPKDVENPKLAKYMTNYLTMICAVTSIMLIVSKTEENREKREELWNYFDENNADTCKIVRNRILGKASTVRSKINESVVTLIYRLSRKIFKFN